MRYKVENNDELVNAITVLENYESYFIYLDENQLDYYKSVIREHIGHFEKWLDSIEPR